MKDKNMKIFGLLHILLFTLIIQYSYAQDIKVNTSIDSSTIKIGDQIKYHIELEQPENAKLQIPVLSDKIGEKIEIIQAIPPDTIREKNLLRIRYDYLITSFDSGLFTIPAFSIPYSNGNTRDTLLADSLSLAVMNLPVDTATQVMDIKSPMRTPVNFAEAWPYILVFWVVILIMVAIWFLVSKKKKKGFFFTPKVQELPHIIALRELDNLRTQKLWQNSKVKQYYVDLTEIIRKYIELRFEIRALEMTSDEISDAFKYNNFVDPESKILLNKLFSQADLVKFAKAQPLPDENEVNLLNAYQFVNNTKITESVISGNSNQETDNNQELNK